MEEESSKMASLLPARFDEPADVSFFIRSTKSEAVKSIVSFLTKERKLLIRYYLQQAVRRARVFAPACWLGFSAVFFFVVLMAISRLSPYLLADDPPRQIEGVVSQNIKGGNPPQAVPAIGATVECGEYRCSSGVDGRFAMSVRGREKTIVPLIITFGSKEQVERVQLADGREKTICTFVLR